MGKIREAHDYRAFWRQQKICVRPDFSNEGRRRGEANEEMSECYSLSVRQLARTIPYVFAPIVHGRKSDRLLGVGAVKTEAGFLPKI
jgi:hypothetical protein